MSRDLLRSEGVALSGDYVTINLRQRRLLAFTVARRLMVAGDGGQDRNGPLLPAQLGRIGMQPSGEQQQSRHGIQHPLRQRPGAGHIAQAAAFAACYLAGVAGRAR